MSKRLDFSARGQARVVLIVVTGVIVTMAVAAVAVSYTTQFMDPGARALTWDSAILIPILMSGPIFYLFASKLRELAIAHYELAIIASQDSLTTCLNRGAFVTLVDAYLSQVNAAKPIGGAMLVIDADNFKTINDRFGHATGDHALRLIAAAIKDGLRPDDLVGRVGGEEFAVFLPHVDDATAVRVAERICHKVGSVEFAPTGKRERISVSVGGVGFAGPIPFDDLFRAADARLYEAKRNGRDRVEFRTAFPQPSPPCSVSSSGRSIRAGTPATSYGPAPAQLRQGRHAPARLVSPA